jgi:hypothetical protein
MRFSCVANKPVANQPLHLAAAALLFFAVQGLASRRGRRTVSFDTI